MSRSWGGGGDLKVSFGVEGVPIAAQAVVLEGRDCQSYLESRPLSRLRRGERRGGQAGGGKRERESERASQ
jgi:hypothetical protein